MFLKAYGKFLVTFHARKIHFFKTKSWLKIRNFWRPSWIYWFCKVTDGVLILTCRYHMLTLWICKSIFWLRRTSLECFWTHQNSSWPFFMQGKSTFSRQKVDWKSEISDDPLESIDFVRWRMGILYWLVDIICWLCGYVRASPDFDEQVWSVFERIRTMPDEFLCKETLLFRRQKVDWKSEISDDHLEFIDKFGR